MSKRVTVMIHDDVVKKVRIIQAKKIQKENRSVSVSEIINELLKEAI
jgi:hypothetical protein